MTTPSLNYRYRVDAADRLTWVDDQWLAFARENGAAGLVEPMVVGRSLWEFMQDDATRELYQEIHERIRATGNPLVMPFRCDSPLLQRHMQLTISREPGGQLMYHSRFVRVIPQPSCALLDPNRERSDAFLSMCSCCKRSLLEPVGWLDLEDISVRLRIFEMPKIPQVHYTVCPSCALSAGKKHGIGFPSIN
jgi:predicted Fe-S protein YdhL (DUF1289 family)